MRSLSNFPIYSPMNSPMNFTVELTKKVILKKDFVRKDGTCALYVQVFLNKEKKLFPLALSVKPSDFDEVNRCVKKTHPFAKDYNLLIDQKLAQIHTIEVNHRLSRFPLTIESLIQEVENPLSRIDFLYFWENELKKQKDQIKPGTYRQQNSALNKLREFKSVIYFYEINEEFVKTMTGFFKNKKGNSANTVSSLLKNFKKYLHIANKRGIVTPIMHDEVKRQMFTKRCTFLTTQEIQKLYKYWQQPFINATYKAILSRFLFACFSSVRLGDILRMTQDNIIGDTLIFSAEKTTKLHRIPISRTARVFLDKEFVFPGKFSPEYINRELKHIAKAVGIQKTLTFHVSRHTFATQFLLCGGNVVNLQKILGHSKIEETMIYVHVVEEIVDRQIHNMDEILGVDTFAG